jgi:major type 1 subunit fimbrin (pilin)
MKNRSLFATAITSAVISCSALAADGNIIFTGSITDSACKVYTASANQTVNMGTVATSSFGAAGATAGAARFSISMMDCPASAKTASIRFDGPVHSGNSSVLSLSSGQTAKNLGVVLYQIDSTTPIPIGSPTPSVQLTTSGTYTFDFIAKYFALSTPVGAGTANANATFTVAYN